MGKYINNVGDPLVLPTNGKADFLIEHCNATEIPSGTGFDFQPDLVCVVQNFYPTFDAAAYAYSKQEMEYFLSPEDRRPKRWLILPGVERMVDKY